MSALPVPPLLDETLRVVARRYRLPALDTGSLPTQGSSPATSLAIAIEQARGAVARAEEPGAPLKRFFIEALAQMIRDAMRAESGDPVFQAMVLRHRAASVREYASLFAHADQDRRVILAAVNAVAHPAKPQRMLEDGQRETLARLHACASASSWSELRDVALRLLDMPGIANDPTFGRGLTKLLDSPALGRMQRLDALASDDLVRQYRSLWDRHGPRPGSAKAVARGMASQQRGAAVEALAAQALEALARRLDDAAGEQGAYRVVTSVRVPASLPASHERAKSEWDAILLRRASAADESTVWDVCLLVEAKASVDAATTDLPRLVRGLRLLAHAHENAVYSFATRQGSVRLRGASLRALTTDEAGLRQAVLYCCDAPAEVAPRLLGAASRMQLLSAHASLEFASTLVDGHPANPQDLGPVWHQLLESPRWRAVLDQYSMLRQVRDLMVHTDDLLAAINGTAERG